MRRLLFAAAAAASMGWPASASADCKEQLGELSRSLTGGGEVDYRTVLRGTEQQVRQLRDAARIFAANGMDESCTQVVAGIREMLDQRLEASRADNSYATREDWTSRERDRLGGAQPTSSLTAPIRAEEVIGADVRNHENEDLGEIVDIVVDPTRGAIDYAIVASGGFFGGGEKLVAVPWRKFRITPENDVYVLNIAVDAFSKAPSFESSEPISINEAEWRAANDKFYEENVL